MTLAFGMETAGSGVTSCISEFPTVAQKFISVGGFMVSKLYSLGVGFFKAA